MTDQQQADHAAMHSNLGVTGAIFPNSSFTVQNFHRFAFILNERDTNLHFGTKRLQMSGRTLSDLAGSPYTPVKKIYRPSHP